MAVTGPVRLQGLDATLLSHLRGTLASLGTFESPLADVVSGIPDTTALTSM